MRTQAIENALRALMESTARVNDKEIQNIRHKCFILLDRNDNSSASVVKEFLNGRA